MISPYAVLCYAMKLLAFVLRSKSTKAWMRVYFHNTATVCMPMAALYAERAHVLANLYHSRHGLSRTALRRCRLG